MSADSTVDLELFRRYSRPIIHLRQQIRRRKLGLVIGAGVSQTLGFPGWNELVGAIVTDTTAKFPIELSHHISELPPTTQIQVAFEHFRNSSRAASKDSSRRHELGKTDELGVRAEWRRVIRRALYKGVRLDFNNPEQYPLLLSIARLISEKKVDLAVTYNFDDSLERAIQHETLKMRESVKGSTPPRTEISLGYQTIWSMGTQQDPDNTTIYHPNGFISSRPQDLQSDSIVFSDEEFSDQLMQGITGELSTLTHYFSQNTCLLIGLSLRDTNLRYLLRQSKLLAPGNVHYLIYRISDANAKNRHALEGLFKAHFSAHNLYTMFLTDTEILSLLTWLSLTPSKFRELKEEHALRNKFVFYVTGSPSVGKSTVVSSLRGFRVVNEWVEPSHPFAAQDFNKLSVSEKNILDVWISRQFRLKNRFLVEEPEGIFVVDRAPLDPLSYERSTEGRQERATQHAAELAKSSSTFMAGQVILLKGDLRELERRLLVRDKNWDSQSVKHLEMAMEEIYSSTDTVSVETSDFNPDEVAHRILQVMLVDDYRPSEFRLN